MRPRAQKYLIYQSLLLFVELLFKRIFPSSPCFLVETFTQKVFFQHHLADLMDRIPGILSPCSRVEVLNHLCSRMSNVRKIQSVLFLVFHSEKKPPLSNLHTSSPVVHQGFQQGHRFAPSHYPPSAQRPTRRLRGAARPPPTLLAGGERFHLLDSGPA